MDPSDPQRAFVRLVQGRFVVPQAVSSSRPLSMAFRSGRG